jgi:CRP-like cAMP-binding protein
MLDAQPRSASVTAARDSDLRFISRTSFEAIAEARPDLYSRVARMLARRLRDTNALVGDQPFPLPGRVAQALFGLAESIGRDVGGDRVVIRQKVSQSDLAAMAGIAREKVSRILNDWMRKRYLSRLAGYYCLENRSAPEREVKI